MTVALATYRCSFELPYQVYAVDALRPPPHAEPMADDLSGYFELAAQVIPVLLLALVIESGFLPQLRAEVAALRTPHSVSITVSPTNVTVTNPTNRPIPVVLAEVLTEALRTSAGMSSDMAYRVVTYVQASPKVRSFLAVLAIDVTLIGAVVCEAIALACVVFDVPRRWQEVLGLVVLAGLIALLGLTLFALRRLTVHLVKADKADDPDDSVG